MAIIEQRGNCIYMLGDDIPSIILHIVGMSRKFVISKRVYVYDQVNMTLSICHECFKALGVENEKYTD